MAIWKQPTTIFIHNLPEKMHWKGLWATFAHHGEVIDAFIPRKRSRNGRKFGFVRYSSRVDVRTSFWRKVNHGKQEASKSTGNTQKIQSNNNLPDTKHTPFLSLSEEESRRKIAGFVDEEALRKLQSSLIGYTAAENDSGNLMDRLCSWGLGDIKIKKVVGRVFLLETEDATLFNSLKESGWATLLEIFTDIQPWSESFRIPERTTWLELRGIPPHCWNHFTFKRIANM
ncbi:hypothetical protein V6N13_115689 [Hibiscus sabdariffa]